MASATDNRRIEDNGSARPDPAATQLAEVIACLHRIHEAVGKLVALAEIDTALTRIRNQTENNGPPMTETDRRNGQYWLFIQCLAARMPAVLDGLQSLYQINKADLDIGHAQRLAALLPGEGNPRTLSSISEMTAKEKEDAGLASAINRYKRIFWDWDHWTNRCREENLYTPNDAGVVGHSDQLVKLLQAWEAKSSEGGFREDKDLALAKAGTDQKDAEQGDELAMAFPIDELASATERADALLGHIAAHAQHYSYALFQALTPSEQVSKLLRSSGGQLQVGLFEPRVVAMHGDRLAVPLTPLAVGGLEQFMSTLRTALTAALTGSGQRSDTIVIPTPGVNVASRLGACSTAEAFVEESREIDLQLARARLRQAEAEAAAAEAEALRRTRRLGANDFDPFAAPSQ